MYVRVDQDQALASLVRLLQTNTLKFPRIVAPLTLVYCLWRLCFVEPCGIQSLPGLEQIFLLLFADDVILISSTPSGLQNQIDNLEKASKSLSLAVNLDKTKLFRKGGHIASRENVFVMVAS